ncbi:unnamed protein product [Lymnaea stagnalis]|uniref:Uncharacterized protein n=1 Tax=Lymnaea stagnalis TaxID=6523 RepID=A0AAV2HTN7_LYMST
MSVRSHSPGRDSSNGSSPGLQAVSGISRTRGLPEEWTLPQEWNIEKREPFDNWKKDVQSQITNISRSVTRSLEMYPHPDVGSGLSSGYRHHNGSKTGAPYSY